MAKAEYERRRTSIKRSAFDLGAGELRTRLDNLEKEMTTLKLELERLRLSRLTTEPDSPLKLK